MNTKNTEERIGIFETFRDHGKHRQLVFGKLSNLGCPSNVVGRFKILTSVFQCFPGVTSAQDFQCRVINVGRCLYVSSFISPEMFYVVMKSNCLVFKMGMPTVPARRFCPRFSALNLILLHHARNFYVQCLQRGTVSGLMESGNNKDIAVMSCRQYLVQNSNTYAVGKALRRFCYHPPSTINRNSSNVCAGVLNFALPLEK